MNLKLILGMTYHKWSWWRDSSAWLHALVSNWFLVCKLHIRHMTKVISSIASFFQRLPLIQVLNSHHLWKLLLVKGNVTFFFETNNLIFLKILFFFQWPKEIQCSSFWYDLEHNGILKNVNEQKLSL